MREEGIDLKDLPDSSYDSLMGLHRELVLYLETRAVSWKQLPERPITLLPGRILLRII
nr:hypothetical protein [[Clostridium] hylemonae]